MPATEKAKNGVMLAGLRTRRMSKKKEKCDALGGSFSWNLPERYNIGVDACDEWADDSERRDRSTMRYSFDDWKGSSHHFSNSAGTLE